MKPYFFMREANTLKSWRITHTSITYRTTLGQVMKFSGILARPTLWWTHMTLLYRFVDTSTKWPRFQYSGRSWSLSNLIIVRHWITLSSDLRRETQGFDNTCPRRTIGYRFYNQVLNPRLLRKTDSKLITCIVLKRRLYGHATTFPKVDHAHRILFERGDLMCRKPRRYSQSSWFMPVHATLWDVMRLGKENTRKLAIPSLNMPILPWSRFFDIVSKPVYVLKLFLHILLAFITHHYVVGKHYSSRWLLSNLNILHVHYNWKQERAQSRCLIQGGNPEAGCHSYCRPHCRVAVIVHIPAPTWLNLKMLRTSFCDTIPPLSALLSFLHICLAFPILLHSQQSIIFSHIFMVLQINLIPL